MVPKSANAGEICLECGLCCNGVIFADVQLQPGDLPDRLRELGLKLLARAKRPSRRRPPSPRPRKRNTGSLSRAPRSMAVAASMPTGLIIAGLLNARCSRASKPGASSGPKPSA